MKDISSDRAKISLVSYSYVSEIHLPKCYF